jgi:hypothetical protein
MTDNDYWFTKVNEWTNPHKGCPIISSCLSPNSSVVATLGTDEELRFWRMFESLAHLQKAYTNAQKN